MMKYNNYLFNVKSKLKCVNHRTTVYSYVSIYIIVNAWLESSKPTILVENMIQVDQHFQVQNHQFFTNQCCLDLFRNFKLMAKLYVINIIIVYIYRTNDRLEVNDGDGQYGKRLDTELFFLVYLGLDFDSRWSYLNMAFCW